MFIKKRKITKASIEELAKRYPQDIISDEDARNIVGGTHYYSPSGYYLGQWDDGSNAIKIIDDYYYREYTSSGAMAHFDSQTLLDKRSIPLSNASYDTRTRVYQDMLNAVGGQGIVLSIYDEKSLIAASVSGPMVFVNEGFTGNISDTIKVDISGYYEKMCIMTHEAYHTNDSSRGAKGEVLAWQAMINCQYFSATNKTFQDIARQTLEYYKQLAATEASSGGGVSGNY